MIETDWSIFICRGPGYFLLRENNIETRILYSYCLVFLIDPLVQKVAGIWSSASCTPLHTQVNQPWQCLWQPIATEAGIWDCVSCSRGIPSTAPLCHFFPCNTTGKLVWELSCQKADPGGCSPWQHSSIQVTRRSPSSDPQGNETVTT